MKKLILIFIFPFALTGCHWWPWVAGPTLIVCNLDKKEKKRDEIRKAQISEKYKHVNKKRKKTGEKPQIEPEEQRKLVNFDRQKSTILY